MLNLDINIKEIPDLDVAFFRRTGSYFEPQDHWEKLFQWASNNGLFPPHQSFIGISLDNPDLVESSKCRHDACVTIPEGFEIENHSDINFRKIDGGKFVVYTFYDNLEKLNLAYHYLYSEWLPNSEFDADFNRYNLEFTLNNPIEDPHGKLKVDLYVPIKERASAS